MDSADIDLEGDNLAPAGQGNLEIPHVPSVGITTSRRQDQGIHAKKRFQCQIRMSSRQRMSGSLLLGVLFAICHHSFYKYLDGQLPWTGSLQEWPIRLGNLFAFSSKIFLVVAVSEAYSQQVWTSLASKFRTVAAINALFEASNGFFALLELILDPDYRSTPKLAILLCVISWALSVTTLFTPATLSVGPSRPYDSLRPVPRINFTNYSAFNEPLNFLSEKYNYGGQQTFLSQDTVDHYPNGWVSGEFEKLVECELCTKTPSPELLSLARTTLIRRQITVEPMTWAPEDHLFYSLTFNGPSINCGDPIDRNALTPNGTSILDILETNPWRMKWRFRDPGKSRMDYPLGFPSNFRDITFLRNRERIFEAIAPSDRSGNNGWRGGAISNLYNSPYQFWFGVYDHTHTHKAYVCKLYNASYTADFKKQASFTSVVLKDVLYGNEIIQHNVTWRDGTPWDVWYGAGGPHTRPAIPQTATELSYVAVLQSYLVCIVGTLPPPDPNSCNFNNNPDSSDAALLAAFFDSMELASKRLNPWLAADSQWSRGMADARNMTLAKIIEEQFSNITLSLFAMRLVNSPAIVLNSTPPINITINNDPSTYHYNASTFWLVNGLAISFALFSICIGHIALRLNKDVRHTNSFLSILTTTRRNARLDELPGIGLLHVDGGAQEELLGKKLKFGQMDVDGGDGRVGFGFQGQVYGIPRGRVWG